MHVDRTFPDGDSWWEWFNSGGTRVPRVAPEEAREQFREAGLAHLRDATSTSGRAASSRCSRTRASHE